MEFFNNMLSLSTSNNYQNNNQLSKDVLKGFLYKIKNEQNQTIGYLFGTMHKFSNETEHQFTLHDKVFKSLAHCQTLFVERNIFDEKTLVEHLRSQEGSANLNDDLLTAMAKEIIAKNSLNPDGVESLLTLRAQLLRLKVESLETEESRRKAYQAVQEEKESLKHKKTCNVAFWVFRAAQQLEQAIQTCESNDKDKVVKALDHLLEGYDFLSQAIKETKLVTFDYRTKSIIELVNKYEIVFKAFNFDPKFIQMLKILFFAQKEYDESQIKKLDEQLPLAYRTGDKKIIEECEVARTDEEGFWEFKESELQRKELHLRDEFIVDRIHKNLLQSSEKIRSFYAIGSGHLEKNYENAKKMLEKKGWKIVNAYKD